MAKTIVDYSKQLNNILNQIKVGINASTRAAISKKLINFADSLPFDAEYRDLRRRANTESEKLDDAVTEAALKNLQSRTAVLNGYVKSINAVTSKLKKEAKAARLETAQKIADATKNVTKSVLAAKKAFKDGKFTEGVKELDKIKKELAGLKSD